GIATALLCAAAFGRKILSRARDESGGAFPALWVGRFSLFDRASIAPRWWTGRARFVRQPSGLGCAPAEMGMRRLGQSRTGTPAHQACGSLGLCQFRMLVATPDFRQPSR